MAENFSSVKAGTGSRRIDDDIDTEGLEIAESQKIEAPFFEASLSDLKKLEESTVLGKEMAPAMELDEASFNKAGAILDSVEQAAPNFHATSSASEAQKRLEEKFPVRLAVAAPHKDGGPEKGKIKSDSTNFPRQVQEQIGEKADVANAGHRPIWRLNQEAMADESAGQMEPPASVSIFKVVESQAREEQESAEISVKVPSAYSAPASSDKTAPLKMNGLLSVSNLKMHSNLESNCPIGQAAAAPAPAVDIRAIENAAIELAPALDIQAGGQAEVIASQLRQVRFDLSRLEAPGQSVESLNAAPDEIEPEKAEEKIAFVPEAPMPNEKAAPATHASMAEQSGAEAPANAAEERPVDILSEKFAAQESLEAVSEAVASACMETSEEILWAAGEAAAKEALESRALVDWLIETKLEEMRAIEKARHDDAIARAAAMEIENQPNDDEAENRETDLQTAAINASEERSPSHFIAFLTFDAKAALWEESLYSAFSRDLASDSAVAEEQASADERKADDADSLRLEKLVRFEDLARFAAAETISVAKGKIEAARQSKLAEQIEIAMPPLPEMRAPREDSLNEGQIAHVIVFAPPVQEEAQAQAEGVETTGLSSGVAVEEENLAPANFELPLEGIQPSEQAGAIVVEWRPLGDGANEAPKAGESLKTESKPKSEASLGEIRTVPVEGLTIPDLKSSQAGAGVMENEPAPANVDLPLEALQPSEKAGVIVVEWRPLDDGANEASEAGESFKTASQPKREASLGEIRAVQSEGLSIPDLKNSQAGEGAVEEELAPANVDLPLEGLQPSEKAGVIVVEWQPLDDGEKEAPENGESFKTASLPNRDASLGEIRTAPAEGFSIPDIKTATAHEKTDALDIDPPSDSMGLERSPEPMPVFLDRDNESIAGEAEHAKTEAPKLRPAEVKSDFPRISEPGRVFIISADEEMRVKVEPPSADADDFAHLPAPAPLLNDATEAEEKPLPIKVAAAEAGAPAPFDFRPAADSRPAEFPTLPVIEGKPAQDANAFNGVGEVELAAASVSGGGDSNAAARGSSYKLENEADEKASPSKGQMQLAGAYPVELEGAGDDSKPKTFVIAAPGGELAVGSGGLALVDLESVSREPETPVEPETPAETETLAKLPARRAGTASPSQEDSNDRFVVSAPGAPGTSGPKSICSIYSEPDGATVYHGGTLSYPGPELGQTPLTAAIDLGKTDKVMLRKPGYRDSIVRLAGCSEAAVAMVPSKTVLAVRPPKYLRSTVEGLYVGSYSFASPNPVDYNDDDRPDLLVGDGSGEIYLYENKSEAGAPEFAMGRPILNLAAQSGGSEAAPYAVDWNEDGKFDILVGTGNGNIYVQANIGGAADPKFDLPQPIRTGPHMLSAGSDAHPAVADWNGDGRKDLLVGRGDGAVDIYLNQGANEEPSFSVAQKLQLEGKMVDVGEEAMPYPVDYNQDGLLDIAVGNRGGKVVLFINRGVKTEPKFMDEIQLASVYDPRGYAAPFIMDWDNDGTLDLLAGNASGELLLYSGFSE